MGETILGYIEANAHLKRCVSERDAEIAQLRQQVDAWQATGNTIMLCAVGREAPLSDSDVCGEINALRQQVAELQAQIAYHDRRMSIAVGALENIENVGAEVAPYSEHAAQVQMFDTAQDALRRITELDYEQMGVD